MAIKIRLISALILTAFSSLASVAGQHSPIPLAALPIVDLGYELHQASSFNATGSYYNFTDIRFAAAPIGPLRFAAPQSPPPNRFDIQKGSVNPICPQASPSWWELTVEYVPRYLSGERNFNTSSFMVTNTSSSTPEPDPRETEDCLFLDVVVPKAILENAGNGYGAPVLVWIHGGGTLCNAHAYGGTTANC